MKSHALQLLWSSLVIFPWCLSCVQTQLCSDHGHSPLMKKVFEVHLCFLRINQSDTALKQVFTSLRTFIYKASRRRGSVALSRGARSGDPAFSLSPQFPCTFFEGRADMCAAFCYEILKCCNSKLSNIRSDAAHLLYFLMKSNFDYTARKSFVRTHLQVPTKVNNILQTNRISDHLMGAMNIYEYHQPLGVKLCSFTLWHDKYQYFSFFFPLRWWLLSVSWSLMWSVLEVRASSSHCLLSTIVPTVTEPLRLKKCSLYSYILKIDVSVSCRV